MVAGIRGLVEEEAAEFGGGTVYGGRCGEFHPGHACDVMTGQRGKRRKRKDTLIELRKG